MNLVTINDRQFTISITAEQIQQRVAEVAAQIDKDLAGKNPLFLAVLNGSFVFAADLMRGITTPSEISFVRLASYEGMGTTGHVKEVLGLTENLEGRTVVIIEDIIDSGFTMQKLVADLRKQNPAALHLAALLVKPGNMQVELDIDYTCFSIPNDFIVGYGLDYDGYGRNLPAIYTVVNN
ncbi:MAG: hypoxanthine phosphoribosyltransferase [Bacteroidales bacterium]|nr:hypoxanthine phosphoribosyltransferase [Bacteroidales bacterium]